MTRKNKKAIALMISGIVLFLAAVGLALYNYYSEYKAGADSAAVLEQLIPENQLFDNGLQSEIPGYVLNPDMEMPVKEIDGHTYVGILEIFSLGIELPIMEEWSYPNFRISPCVYEGTPYKNNLIVAAHNYRSHFGNIKQLVQGDKISFTDMHNNVFNYEVLYSEVIDRDAVSELKAGEWDLTLFTCTPGGRSRVVVRCVLISE